MLKTTASKCCCAIDNTCFNSNMTYLFTLHYKYLISSHTLKPSELLSIYYNWQDMEFMEQLSTDIPQIIINITMGNNLVQH